MALEINGVVVPGSIIFSNASGARNGTQPETGTAIAIVTLAAGDILTVNNVGTVATALGVTTQGQTSPSVAITIIKIA
ncbi:hypothetical protein I6N90_12900 [Paenibacillus sp. GSMTC-2017]|uniref:hypothetical protein n=1 Tax=Paenibacillus sp. GSMTC-2017 TaxID=2794350 RepID=UPI0018D6B8BA|nr:hypothetical protein [Paenibacillus sp. GSMTC-2017]MBH5318697.1 hypothetical protein [Paenibacillus sp. GSMTC-2017]